MGWYLVIHTFWLVNLHEVTVCYLLASLGATLTIFAPFSGCKFKNTAKVDYFSNEGVAVNKVVNVAVFEVIEVSSMRFLFNDYRQDLRCIQLGWSVEVDLAEKTS